MFTIKIEHMSANQLIALHRCFQDKDKEWADYCETNNAVPQHVSDFFKINSVRTTGYYEQEIEHGNTPYLSGPIYDVVIEVQVAYEPGRDFQRELGKACHALLTPLSCLAHMLHAIGLFPDEVKEPFSGEYGELSPYYRY